MTYFTSAHQLAEGAPSSAWSDSEGTSSDHSFPIESPALVRSSSRATSAFELKFLLSEGQAREVEALLQSRLVLDAHGDPALGHAYRITSLYCDTPAFDVFHRVGFGKRRKHRIRRYGKEASLFLERKTKWGDRVRKLRTKVAEADLQRLADRHETSPWEGDWFHRQLARRQQRPVCLIAYERVAYVGASHGEPVRLTFDRQIRGALCNEWRLEQLTDGTPILAEGVVCEFKYRGAMPAFFKEAMQTLRLSPTSVSKYRRFLEAAGFLPLRRPVNA